MAREERHHQLLSSGLSTMLADHRFTDFEIRSEDGTSLPCHKVILAAVSPFFERMLETEMKESQLGAVDLSFETSTVRDILSYIYKGSDIIKPDNVPDIYYAANYLSIASLVTDCEEFLKAELPERVSLEIWQIAKFFEKHEIVEISKSKVLKDFTLLCNTDCMSILSRQSMIELLNDPYLNCTGTLKCRAAWFWVTSHDIDTSEVGEVIKALALAKNVECDDIICACANEEDDELDKSGDDLVRVQEMWANTCDKLWIKPSPLNPSKSALVPFVGSEIRSDILVCLDEGQTGDTRLTFFDYRQKKWYKMDRLNNLELGYRYAVCSDGSLLYLSGGHVKNRKQKRFIRFDCGSKDCLHLADMPVGREQHSMCKVGRYLYVLGGVSDHVPTLDEVHKYSLVENRWSKCGNIILPVSQHSCVTVGSMIYLLGGCTPPSSRAPSDTAQYYDTVTNISGTLETSLTVKCKLANTAMTVINNHVYFLHHGEVFKFDPKSKVSQKATKCGNIEGAPHKGFIFASFESKILVFGGEDDNFRTVRQILQFDCQTNKSVKLPLKTPWPLQDFTCVKLQVPSSWDIEEVQV